MKTLGKWFHNSSLRTKLLLMVGVPTCIALLGIVLALLSAVEAYQRSRVLQQNNQASNYIIFAAAEQAKERGFTVTVLSDPTAKNTLAQIYALRRRGDLFLDTALIEAAPLLNSNAVINLAYRKVRECVFVRNQMRLAIDTALGKHAMPRDFILRWFKTQTDVILAEAEFNKALFIAQNPYELIVQYNTYIKNHVLMASEFAGRERAMLANVIASGKAVTPETLENLKKWRGVVEENLSSISQLRANPTIPQNLINAIGNMEVKFLAEYEYTRNQVYAVATHPPSDSIRAYPISTDEWIQIATVAIDAVLNVSLQISEEAEHVSVRQQIFSQANVLIIITLLIIICLTLIASFAIGVRIILPIYRLKVSAEAVTQGDFSQQVEEKYDDEIGQLGRTFNQMVEALKFSFEQLEEEKTSVEVQVQQRTLELATEKEQVALLAQKLAFQNEQLLTANKELERAGQEKLEFLAICSHDLKNPLSAILTVAELLVMEEHESVPTQYLQYGDIILRSAQQMFGLIKNLLEVSAIEQGKQHIALEKLELRSMVLEVCESFRPHAESKNISILAEIVRPFQVVADKNALHQILTNLVSNAVKYSSLSSVVVVTADARETKVCVSVKDSGPGLSADDRKKLFGKFVRLQSRPTGGEHSTGLGLYIAKRMTELMHGNLRCESELGKGAVFILELPAVIEP